MTDYPPSLAAAVAELQLKLPVIRKSETAKVSTKSGPDYSYTYADLAQVTREVMPLLGALGLSFLAKPTLNADGKFVLAYKLLHTSGDHEDGEYPLPSAGTPQAIGSAITYGRRYCLCAVTGIAPEDDDDGAAAEAQKASSRGSAQRAAPARRQAAPRPEPDTEQRPTAQRAQRAASAPPALPGEERGDGIIPAQQRMMHALFNKVDMAERDDRLRYAGEIVGRDLASSGDLTKKEAGQVLDKLQAWAGQLEPDGES